MYLLFIQNTRNLKHSRNFADPKKPIRRPKQQSINWTPPSNKNRSSNNHTSNRSREDLRQTLNRQGSNVSNTSDNNKRNLKQSKPIKLGRNEDSKMPDKNASSKNTDKKTQKTLLEEYFKNKNLGQMLFKIATMGNKGKER